MRLLTLFLCSFTFRDILDISGNAGSPIGSDLPASLNHHPAQALVRVQNPEFLKKKGCPSTKNLSVGPYHPVGILFPETLLEKIEGIFRRFRKSEKGVGRGAYPGGRSVQRNFEEPQISCTRRQREGLLTFGEILLNFTTQQNLTRELSVPYQNSSQKQQQKERTPRQPRDCLSPGREENSCREINPSFHNHVVRGGGERGEKTIYYGEQRGEPLSQSDGRLRWIGGFEGCADICIAFHLAEVLKGPPVDKAVGHLSSADPLKHILGRVVETKGDPWVVPGDAIHRPRGALYSKRCVTEIVEIFHEGIVHMSYHQSTHAGIGAGEEQKFLPLIGFDGSAEHINSTLSGGLQGLFPARKGYRPDIETERSAEKVYVA
jgi:hypothetical protein